MLRELGVSIPTYRAYRRDTWEVDWSKRDSSSRVWARNPFSKMPKCREWHWVSQGTLTNTNVKWQRCNRLKGRFLNGQGYVQIPQYALSPEDIELARSNNLLKHNKRSAVLEHQLVAVKKYGSIPPGWVVRHKNGIKSDNDSDNILIGTTQENTMDHNTARLAAMWWREQFFVAASLLLQVASCGV